MNKDIHQFNSDIVDSNKSKTAPHLASMLYLQELSTAIPTYQVLRAEGDYKDSFVIGEKLNDTNIDDLLEMEFKLTIINNIPSVKE